MNMKKTGLTASGKPRPEFKRGDIYRDQYGGTVMIKGVAGRCVTYRRKGYEYDCVMPVYQFSRDFSLVQAVPRNVPTSNVKALAKIQKMKKMINAFRGKK
ncbi:TPA: DUF4222 domain-containing protein [Escherichia coli]|jgi:hypothetical protein|uniref:DUF4222 domain-containing protein n=2 Tax=Escherichia coli TaxID=562 RepID=UPI0003915A79|nr:DUF4222 domain-containing protein [Escherichia coli]EFA8196540.1 DUF4222 domain-containing protein [Escherichia coli O111]EMA1346584.1 DUF4222 domain-containing protein [Escherichia coli O26]HBC3216205.1 DUF4222 domain-containing protein [Escherichia coli O146]HDQ6707739.1 DUF4222 domain-containing protein [Escherichia coli O146:H21]HDQ6827439.1 DUF4222 domain-containing protein [Escherichia coli O128:H2]